MKQHAKKAIYHIASVFSAAVVVFFIILLLAQIRQLNQDVKEQTIITQRYLRCLLLLPESAFATTESRAEAIDRCARDSFIPEVVTPQPANQSLSMVIPSELTESQAPAAMPSPQPTPPAPSPPPEPEVEAPVKAGLCVPFLDVCLNIGGE